MKYIFFGTPRFAKIVLEDIIDAKLIPTAIVCNPDRPTGRKKTITPPPTKVLAIESTPDIDILQPEKIDEIFLKRLKALEPDFFVVAAYGKILPKSVLEIPRLGTLGVHPSLLPKYRGAAPIQSAILSGDAETGTTIYLMDEKTDHGPILAEEKLAAHGDGSPIWKLPYLELEEQLAKLGAKLLITTISQLLAGQTAPRVQDESLATFTKKFTTEDGFISPEDLAAAEQGDQKKATVILQKMNALNPEPGAWTTNKAGERTKLLEAEIQNGALQLITIQEAGGKPKKKDALA